MSDNESEVMMVARERAAYVAFWLAEGRTFTTAQVAERTGLSHSGARRLLKAISRVIPICEEKGIWFKIPP